jgi:phage shock protein A
MSDDREHEDHEHRGEEVDRLRERVEQLERKVEHLDRRLDEMRDRGAQLCLYVWKARERKMPTLRRGNNERACRLPET